MGHLYQPIKDVEYFAVAHLPHGVVGGADGGEGRALQVLRPDGVDPDASHHKPGDALGEEAPQARVPWPCEAVPWPCDSPAEDKKDPKDPLSHMPSILCNVPE